LDDLKQLELIFYHKNLAKEQRKIFNAQRKDQNLLNDNLLITMDFKSDVPLG
jgi:hypothetical protein